MHYGLLQIKLCERATCSEMIAFIRKQHQTQCLNFTSSSASSRNPGANLPLRCWRLTHPSIIDPHLQDPPPSPQPHRPNSPDSPSRATEKTHIHRSHILYPLYLQFLIHHHFLLPQPHGTYTTGMILAPSRCELTRRSSHHNAPWVPSQLHEGWVDLALTRNPYLECHIEPIKTIVS